MNSRRKGKEGELSLARKLREYGYDCRRGQQYSGAYDAIAQAKHDAREGETPVVMHRKDRCGWLVTLELADFITKFYREWEAGR